MTAFSFSAFAGFNTGEHQTFLKDNQAAQYVSLYGYNIELGRRAPDIYGNFSREEVTALTFMLMDPMQKFPHAQDLRKRHQSWVLQIVKGPAFKVERKADRGFLRVPAMTLVTITIPATASFDEVGKYLNKHVSLTAEPNSAAALTSELVEPVQLNGCEMQLYNWMVGPT